MIPERNGLKFKPAQQIKSELQEYAVRPKREVEE